MDKPIKSTSKNLQILANTIKNTIILRDKNTYLQDFAGRVCNPLKGECYVASAFLYDLVGGKNVSLYKTLDCNNQYHWCIKDIRGEIFDITGEQYSLEGMPIPSFSNGTDIKSYKLGFSSYKKRVMRLELEFLEYIKTNPIDLDL